MPIGLANLGLIEDKQFAIGKPVAKEILVLSSQYLNSTPLVCYVIDIGNWEMVITDTEDKEYIFKGSLCGGVAVGDMDLTLLLRRCLPIE